VFDLVGKTLGSYTISALIGRGGMATVYKARQQTVNREVAIKVMNERAEAESLEYQRFVREVQLIANLEHLHILPIYDYGQVEGFPYIVMRYLEGGSLSSRLRAKSLSLADIERLLSQIAAALDYMHAKGVIHRDLKPHNILLDAQGNAYLCDFGIAKLSGSHGLTRTGEAVGTPSYMAPEQWQALTVMPQTDVYALGALLFEMLTGKPPFQAENVFSLMYKHLNDLPPLLGAYRTDLPTAVDGVIQRALAKLPADRFETAGALAQAFSAALRATQERRAVPAQTRTTTGSLMPVQPLTVSSKPPETFVEHSWALEAFQRWRADRTAVPVLYVVGAHGIGKSTLMRRFAQLLGERVIHYELISGQARSLDPRTFVDSIAWQLGNFLPVDQEAPTGDALREVLLEPREAFESRVLAPLAELPPSPPIFLLIDALEAAFEHSGDTIADLVRAALQNFPDSLRLVVASAPHPELEPLFRGARCLALHADNDEDRDALFATLSTRLAALMPNLTSGDVDLTALIEKAQGNPLYLNVVTACLAYQQLNIAELDALPSGLDALWEALLARLSPEARQPLYLLTAARAPLPSRLLARLLNLEPSALPDRLARLRPLLQESADKSGWQLTHSALRYWLLDNAAEQVRAAHQHLVKTLQRADPEAMELYALQHLPAHALRAEGGLAAFAWLTDIAFLTARLKRVSVAEVLDDLLEARLALRDEGHLARAAALESVAKAVQSAIPNIGGDPNALFGQLYNRLQSVPALAELLRESAARWQGTWLRTVWSPYNAQPQESLPIWQGAPIMALAVSRAPSSAISRLAAEAEAVAGTAWLAACADGLLRLWLDGVLSREWLAAERNAVLTACALSGDGRYALSADQDGEARLWDLASDLRLHIWTHRRAVRDCALSADAALALTASEDRLLRLWDVQSGALRAEFHLHPSAVTCCAFASGANGVRLAISGDAEGTLRLWDAASEALVQAFEAHRGAVTACVGLEARHPLVISGGNDGQVRVWDARNGQLLRSLAGGTNAIADLAVAYVDERLLIAAANEDKTLRLWDAHSGRLLARYAGHRAALTACAIDPTGRLLSCGREGALRLWTLPETTQTPIESHGAAVQSVAFTPDSRRVISASLDRELRVWQAETGAQLQTLRGHLGSVYSLALRADGRVALSASSDRTLRAWDVERGAQLRQYGAHNDAVFAAAFSLRPLKIGGMARPNWLVAAGGAERVIRLYDAESGQLVLTLKGHRDAVIACLFSSSDELLLSLSKDRSAHLWSLPSGALLRTFAEPDVGCTAAAFHPEGALILLGTADGALNVFDRRTGAMALFAHSGSAPIVACGYAQHGALLFSADAARWLRLYDVRTQKILATFRAAHAVTCAAAAPSGVRFAIGDAKGGLTVVQLEGQPSSGRKRNLL
jgi:WD40 repeat protein/tRNA A-37 threonylcarbamoyl transferase component Bud32